MMTEIKSRVEDKFSIIQKAMDDNAYDIVVKECCGLFEVAFKKIFQEAVASFSFEDRNLLIEKEKEIGKGKKGINDFGFGELVGLFRETGLMKKWTHTSNRDIGLIDTINYNSIVSLRNDLVHKGGHCGRVEADLVFNYAKNLYATLGLFNMENSIKASFEPQPAVSTAKGDSREKVNIALIRERGIIVNQSDDSRNISYKVDTINRMLTVVYNKTKDLAGEDAAKEMLFEMGYDSGSAFGRVMNERWEIEKEDVTFKEKFERWCDFDSEVGWGRFSSSLTVDEEEGAINGNLSIKENFLCYNRKKNDVKLCEFMKGYCEGVIEELLGGLPVTIVCTAEQCPLKNALKKTCKFKVEIKEDDE